MSKDKNTEQICCNKLALKNSLILLLLFTYIAATTIHLFAFSFEFMPTYVVYGETMETVSDFMFLGSKITADGD